jgi:hypothetical protein
MKFSIIGLVTPSDFTWLQNALGGITGPMRNTRSDVQNGNYICAEFVPRKPTPQLDRRFCFGRAVA